MSQHQKHNPCPCGDSSDAFSVYTDGGMHCWSCENEKVPTEFWTFKRELEREGEEGLDIINEWLDEKDMKPVPERDKKSFDDLMLAMFGKARVSALTSRGINEKVAEKYGVRVSDIGERFFQGYDANGRFIALKRKTADSKGQWTSRGKEVHLFGMNAFPAGGKRLLITEGEEDAMAAFQMLEGAKFNTSCVSLFHGAGSLQRAFNDPEVYHYIDSYDEITLCFDADEQGKKATELALDFLDLRKVKVMKLGTGLKDANDYLLSNRTQEFKDAYWRAERYAPEDIILPNDEELKEDVLTGDKTISYAYPYDCFNRVLGGIRMGEMVTTIAPTGIGKTSLFRELEHHFATKTFADGTEFKIGMLHIEENPQEAMTGILSIETGERLHLNKKIVGVLKEGETPKPVDLTHQYLGDKASQSYDKVAARIAFYKDWGSNDAETILSKIRFFVKVLGCKIIFLDHISMVVSDQRTDDERKTLDAIATKLKTSTVEWGYNLQVVSHINRKGEIRGTAAIEQLSNQVIRIERDKKAECEIARNTTVITCEKNRHKGDTGPMGWLRFDTITGRMVELSEEPEELREHREKQQSGNRFE